MHPTMKVYEIEISSDGEPATTKHHIAVESFEVAVERAEGICKDSELIAQKRISKIQEIIEELN